MTTHDSAAAHVARRFNASAERVFDAWLDPALIGRWMFGPTIRDEEVVAITLDPRVGGRFSFVVCRHGHDVEHLGEYLELDRPRRLVFTWATREDLPSHSRMIVETTPMDGGCELTLTQELDPKWADFASHAEDAWAKMLESLARTLEA
jgi:uncharacterized protein YndB with AHSA1/START domain